MELKIILALDLRTFLLGNSLGMSFEFPIPSKFGVSNAHLSDFCYHFRQIHAIFTHTFITTTEQRLTLVTSLYYSRTGLNFVVRAGSSPFNLPPSPPSWSHNVTHQVDMISKHLHITVICKAHQPGSPSHHLCSDF